MSILYLHGWHSRPGGVKPSFLIEHGLTVIEPALPDDDFEEALAIAQAAFDAHEHQVVVGSSRGGAVAMNMAVGDARLVLLCPAWKKWGSAATISESATIFHSRKDDCVPYSDSEELVRRSGLPPYTLMEVGNDHRLSDPESLELLLAACTDDDEELPADDPDEDILEKDWTGHCYTAALAWLRDPDNRDWRLIHGSVLSGGRRINHAWCERDDLIVDLARPIGARITEREFYYRISQPEVSKVYSADEAVCLFIRNRHDGPWEDYEQLDQ